MRGMAVSLCWVRSAGSGLRFRVGLGLGLGYCCALGCFSPALRPLLGWGRLEVEGLRHGLVLRLFVDNDEPSDAVGLLVWVRRQSTREFRVVGKLDRLVRLQHDGRPVITDESRVGVRDGQRVAE